jgi:hypothetical protein
VVSGGDEIVEKIIDVPSLVVNVDVFPAARTVVTILLTSNVDFFLAELLGSWGRRKIGRDGDTFPSDARLS